MTDNGIKFVRASGRAPYRAIMNSKPVQDLLLEKAERVGLKTINEISRIGSVKRANYKLVWDVRPGKNRAHAMVKLDVRNPQSWADVGHNRKWGPFIDEILQRALDSLGGEYS